MIYDSLKLHLSNNPRDRNNVRYLIDDIALQCPYGGNGTHRLQTP